MKNKSDNFIWLSLVVFIAGAACFPVRAQTRADTGPAQVPVPAQADRWTFVPDPVACIGPDIIAKADFIRQLEEQFQFRQDRLPPDQLKMLAQKVLLGMVEHRILLGLAAADGVKPNPELVKSQFRKMLQSFTPEDAENFKQSLQKQHFNLEDYERQMTSNVQTQENLTIEAWKERQVAGKVLITEDEMASFYRHNRQLFVKPEAAVASHILYKPLDQTPAAKAEARQKAENALAKLKNGDDFGALAEQDSACPSGKRKKGLLGEFSRGQMVPAFEQAAFRLQPGQLSDIVETPFGFHLIKLHKHHPESIVPFELAKTKIKTYLKRKKETEIIEKLVAAQKTKLKVEIKF